MAATKDFSKLKKDDLLKKIGSKLSKDQLQNLAEGLHNGSVTGSSFDAAVGQTTGVWPQADDMPPDGTQTASGNAERQVGGAADNS